MGAGALRESRSVNPSRFENRISAFLDRQMRAARLASSSSDILSWFMRTLIPNEAERSPDLVEPDFIFTWGPYPSREDPSLFVEAKRLRGTGDSLAGGYVDEGVIRFVEGSYGKGHDYGIMMGYVQVAPVSGAVSSVDTAMDSRKGATQEQSAFASNNSLCTNPFTHHSSHMQHGKSQTITLVHIFVDLT